MLGIFRVKTTSEPEPAPLRSHDETHDQRRLTKIFNLSGSESRFLEKKLKILLNQSGHDAKSDTNELT